MPDKFGVGRVDRLTIIRRKDLAIKLGVSERTLQRMRDEMPPPVIVSKGTLGWRESDIEAWLETRLVAPVK